MNEIQICTVVYYDGVEAYTTHRALYIDVEGKYKLTTRSEKELKADMKSAGVELLKVDMNCVSFDGAKEFIRNVKPSDIGNTADERDVEYLVDKFFEYFVEQ